MTTGDSDWREVSNYPEYEVNRSGQVRSRSSGALLKPSSHQSGHLVVCLYPGKVQTYVHRLVAEAFIPNPDGHPLVRHWDDDPSNNTVENLRWGDYSHNSQDRVRNGRDGNARKTHCKRNHKFTPETTRIYKGSRYCRPCGAMLAKKYREEKR